uniref:Cadherin domain-containing protein n=1 Tax=Cyprinus carpio TaxID=7962 RepID=A0A8C2FLR8_CYPCA
DNGAPRRTATSLLTVTVSDTNDHGPVFEQNEYRLRIRENVEVGFEVITVRATDGDAQSNANMIYKIVNGEGVNSGFEIDSRNGLVKIRVIISGNVKGQFFIHTPTGAIDVINPLDYEMIREYNLRIKAQDGGRPPLINGTGIVVIQVVDVNDNAPMFVSTPFQATVLENVPIGYSVIHIQAIDSDSGENARLDYCLTDTTPGFPFTINNSTGWITVSTELDRETT